MANTTFLLVNYTLSPVSNTSSAAIVWSTPVNLTFIQANWNGLFDVYLKNITFMGSNITWPVKEINFDRLGDDGRTMNFTLTFSEPYLLGLLVRQWDLLVVHFKYDLLDTDGFFLDSKAYYRGMLNSTTNATTTRLFSEVCSQDEPDNSSTDTPMFESTRAREAIF